MSASSNHQLLYTATGDPSKPLLMMIHGWLSYRGVWRTTVPALQDHFYCVAVDLLGFGDNAKPTDADYSIAAQAQRIVALADELGHQRFSLIGHSMGGQISTHIAALTAPERVDHLVTVGGVATGRLTPFVENFIVPMGRLGQKFPVPVYDQMRNWVENYRWYANFMFQCWFYDMNFVPFDSWKIDRQMSTQRSILLSASKAYDSLFITNLTDYLDCVQAQTLVISGIQDATVPVEQARLLAAKIKNAQLVLYDRCGHFPMFEKTEDYLTSLLTFFNGRKYIS